MDLKSCNNKWHFFNLFGLPPLFRIYIYIYPNIVAYVAGPTKLICHQSIKNADFKPHKYPLVKRTDRRTDGMTKTIYPLTYFLCRGYNKLLIHSSLVRFLTMRGIQTSVDLDQAVKHFFELRNSVSYSMVLNISVKFHSDIPNSRGNIKGK